MKSKTMKGIFFSSSYNNLQIIIYFFFSSKFIANKDINIEISKDDSKALYRKFLIKILIL